MSSLTLTIEQQTLRERVRQYISEFIDLADRDILNSLPSRTVEQDVLDLIDSIVMMFDRALGDRC
jgi:hypothetical protein